jgi:hypothetical protein
MGSNIANGNGSHQLCWALLPSYFRAKCQDFLTAVDLPQSDGERSISMIMRRTFYCSLADQTMKLFELARDC